MIAVDHAEPGRTTYEANSKQFDIHPFFCRAAEWDDLPADTKAHYAMVERTVRAPLLSEIEGLKAERDRWKRLKGYAQDQISVERQAYRGLLSDHDGAALRTQAPDSWRPDRDAVMAIIDANKYEPWTVDRAGQMADAILAVCPQDGAMTAAFVPIDGQCFTSEQDWINRATRVLTGHAQYNNTEHGANSGWRGPHFTALSFDQAGRRVRNGADFKRATVEGTYPVWWIWPDQIAPALRPQTAESGE